MGNEKKGDRTIGEIPGDPITQDELAEDAAKTRSGRNPDESHMYTGEVWTGMRRAVASGGSTGPRRKVSKAEQAAYLSQLSPEYREAHEAVTALEALEDTEGSESSLPPVPSWFPDPRRQLELEREGEEMYHAFLAEALGGFDLLRRFNRPLDSTSPAEQKIEAYLQSQLGRVEPGDVARHLDNAGQASGFVHVVMAPEPSHELHITFADGTSPSEEPDQVALFLSENIDWDTPIRGPEFDPEASRLSFTMNQSDYPKSSPSPDTVI